MDNKLLNCPFCGGSDLFRAADNINSTDRVICKLCKGSAVLWKWNDRVTAQHPAVEALRLCLDKARHDLISIAHINLCGDLTQRDMKNRSKAIIADMDAGLALTSQTPAETSEPVSSMKDQRDLWAQLYGAAMTELKRLEDENDLWRQRKKAAEEYWMGEFVKLGEKYDVFKKAVPAETSEKP